MKITKLVICLFLAILTDLSYGQDRLQYALSRYDYKGALEIIDSLSREIGQDSVDIALQKARCLRKLYRGQEAVETLAGVLHLNQFNVELMAELAESHMQAGNTMDAYQLYVHLSQMQPDNPYFKICQARQFCPIFLCHFILNRC